MKRPASDNGPSASSAVKKARTTPNQVDSAYVSLDGASPKTIDSPTAVTQSVVDGSVTSATSKRRPKIFKCTYDDCDKAFDRPARLEIHIRSHTNERPFACTEPGCGKAFLRSEHLKAHIIAKHADARDYVCSYQLGTNEDDEPTLCGKSFHTGTRLRRHIAAHEEKEQTKCQECGQIFRKQETLQRHIRAQHLHEDAYRCSHVEVGDAEECGQTFPTVGQLKAHQAREHSGVRYFCDACNSTSAMADGGSPVGFVTYVELQTHMKTIHPPTCGLCGHVSESNKALRAHMDIVHQSLSDRQRFDCTHPGCDRKFTKRGNLNVHVQTVHAQVKAFICGQTDLSESKNTQGWSGLGCGTGFGTKAGLEHHVRTQHLGHPASEVYGYTKRSDQAQQPATLATSELTGFAYEEQRPVACLEVGCDSRFRRDHDLVIHLELHHSWNIDDINEALAEMTALQGDKFWIGGYDETAAALQQNGSGPVGVMSVSPDTVSWLHHDVSKLDPELTAH